MERLNIGDKIYDTFNYTEGIVLENNDGVIKYRDNNFNTISSKEKYIYKVNQPLTDKMGIMVCEEFHKDINYPYYVPIANENCHENDLAYFSRIYS